MTTPTPFEEIANKYPLNTFSGETKKELLVLLASIHDSALEKAREAVRKNYQSLNPDMAIFTIYKALDQLRINK